MPQIRFSAPAPEWGAVVARASAPTIGVPSSAQSPSSHSTASAAPSGYLRAEPDANARPTRLDATAVRSALNAGAIAAVVSLIPLAFFLAAPLAGYFGVRFYQRRGGMTEPSGRAGFKFGALVGLFASPIFAVLRAAQIVASGEKGELKRAMIEKLQQAAANSPDPQAHQFADYFASPQGMAILMIFGLVFICVAFVLLSGVGGAISASLVRRKN